ncbi:phage tail tape measure protein [Bacillus velezensis]|uniref:phage tail tape measure protein n=1 Tax=Bacillus velezensis TaxID=492670 RepID=UPI0022B821E8|nr:phage tail tape measure protein [Bacillus velezensis]
MRWLSLRDAVQVGIDFEKQMSKVQAISGGSAAEIAKLREQAKNSVQPLSSQQVRQRMHRVFGNGWI